MDKLKESDKPHNEKQLSELTKKVRGWIPILISNRNGKLKSPYISYYAMTTVISSLALSFNKYCNFITDKLKKDNDKLNKELHKIKNQGLNCCGKKLEKTGYSTYRCAVCKQPYYILNLLK